MKKAALVSAVLLLSSVARAQNTAVPAAAESNSGEEHRIKALEDQVQTLAEEVAVLRGELKAIRDTTSAEPGAGGRVLLASAAVEPSAVAPAVPASDATAQATQTSQLPQSQMGGGTQMQGLGGASGNAKLLRS